MGQRPHQGHKIKDRLPAGIATAAHPAARPEHYISLTLRLGQKLSNDLLPAVLRFDCDLENAILPFSKQLIAILNLVE